MQLKAEVQELQAQFFNMEGTLENFKFGIELIHEQNEAIIDTVNYYEETTKKISHRMTQITNNQIEETLINEYTLTFILDAISAGTLTNNILMESQHQLRNRLFALTSLAKHRLSPIMITPHNPKSALQKLTTALQQLYRIVNIMHTPLSE